MSLSDISVLKKVFPRKCGSHLLCNYLCSKGTYFKAVKQNQTNSGKKKKNPNRNCVLRKWALGNKTFPDSKQGKIQKYNSRMWVPKAGVSFGLSCSHYKVTTEQKHLCEERRYLHFLHKRRRNKKELYCETPCAGPDQHGTSSTKGKNYESNESTGQNNVHINTHEELQKASRPEANLQAN